MITASTANERYTAAAAATTLPQLNQSIGELEARRDKHATAERIARDYMNFLCAQHKVLRQRLEDDGKELASFRLKALEEVTDAPDGIVDYVGLAVSVAKKTTVRDFDATALQYLVETKMPAQRLKILGLYVDTWRIAAELAWALAVAGFRVLYEQLVPLEATGGTILIQTSRTEDLVSAHLEAVRRHLASIDELKSEIDREAKAERARINLSLASGPGRR